MELEAHIGGDQFAGMLESHLVQRWIPALAGIRSRLEHGGRVADLGCGSGASTLAMTRAFPNTSFSGFDPRHASIRVAANLAEASGMSNRVQFQVSSPDCFVGGPYDLITSLGPLGEVGNYAKHVWNRLAPRGSWMIVQSSSSDWSDQNRLRTFVMKGGFSRLRRVDESHDYFVLEASK